MGSSLIEAKAEATDTCGRCGLKDLKTFTCKTAVHNNLFLISEK